jgi:hypothetical protein
MCEEFTCKDAACKERPRARRPRARRIANLAYYLDSDSPVCRWSRASCEPAILPAASRGSAHAREPPCEQSMRVSASIYSDTPGTRSAFTVRRRGGVFNEFEAPKDNMP